MNKYDYFPARLREDPLFKEFLESFDEFATPYELSFRDIEQKYSGGEDLPDEVVEEVLREFGLGSIADLLVVSPVVNKMAVLAFANAIASLKGTEVGYYLVLNLLNFQFDAEAWHEQTPKGIPHTFSLDVNLDASVVQKPYETFQKIKLFTRDYVIPIIAPLGYTYFIPIDGVQIAAKGAAHPTYNAPIQYTQDSEVIYGYSGWTMLDSEGYKWAIKVNENGDLKAFKSDKTLHPPIYFKNPNNDYFIFTVSTTGVIGIEKLLEPPSDLQIIVDTLKLASYYDDEWLVYITGDEEIKTMQEVTLLQENGSPLLTENDDELIVTF